VLYDGHEMGTALVTERYPRKFFGRFIPGAQFANQREPFDEIARCIREAEGTIEVDDVAWNRWVALVHEMTPHIELPEVPAAIEEFAIDERLGLEVTFAQPTA
jgi:hypothetical protein